MLLKTSGVRSWAVPLSGAGLLSALCVPAGAQLGTSLAGVIVSDVTDEPLQGAKVSLQGMRMEAVTGEDGQFLIEGVPSGAFRVTFDAPGYASVVEELEASVGAFLRVRLSPLEAVLDEILVLVGRPPASSRASGFTVDKDGEAWRSILDLLDDQVPGVVVRRGGGNLGGGAFIYIRSAGTLQGDNAPDIYVDGVRIDSQNTGARALHVLDLIPAEDVSSVRVHKGASGAAGFSLGGANGVIEIETNQGRVTRPGN